MLRRVEVGFARAERNDIKAVGFELVRFRGKGEGGGRRDVSGALGEERGGGRHEVSITPVAARFNGSGVQKLTYARTVYVCLFYRGQIQ